MAFGEAYGAHGLIDYVSRQVAIAPPIELTAYSVARLGGRSLIQFIHGDAWSRSAEDQPDPSVARP